MTYRWARRSANNIAPAQIHGAKAGLIKIGGGYAYADRFPDIVAEAMTAVRARNETLQYGPLYGLMALREQVCGYLADDGVIAEPANILITNGAKHGIDLACRVFMERGDEIVVTDPTYMTALSMFRGHELRPVTVPVDQHGMRVDILAQLLSDRRRAGEPIPKLVYDVPDFHNPTGVTMVKDRRIALLALAEKYDFTILEDDPYRRIRFAGEAVPPIKSFDASGRVIGFGTVSKILAPGLRVGWVNADPQIIRRMAALKTDGGSSPLTQKIVAEILMTGTLATHVRDLSTALQGHRDAMMAAIRCHLPDATCPTPDGGYYVWLGLNDAVDTMAVALEAEKLDVSVIPGAHCHAAQGISNELRLCFSYCEPDEITTGIERLAKALTIVRDGSSNSRSASDLRHFD